MRVIAVDAPGGPELLQARDLPIPEPGPGEVTIDVAFAGVGFVDTLFRRGTFALPMPLVPGIEVAGRVRAIGAGVTGLVPGQRVAALLNDFVNLPGAGGYAEIARARAVLTVPLPDSVEPVQAAAVLVNGATAWMAIHDHARLRPGETILVPGATGGLGSMLVLLARQAGVGRIIGLVGNADKQELARRLGYDEVLVAGENDTSWTNVLPERGVDIVLDAVGGAVRRAAFDRLAPLGRLVILGNASGIDAAFSADACWIGNRTIQGLSIGGVAHLIPERIAAAAGEVLAVAARGFLCSMAVQIRPLVEVATAHRLLESRRGTGKIVLAV